MEQTKEWIIEQEVRKVIQSVALHGYDCVLAEKDIFKAVQKFYKEKLRDNLKAFNNFVLKLEEEGKIPLIDTCIDDFIRTIE